MVPGVRRDYAGVGHHPVRRGVYIERVHVDLVAGVVVPDVRATGLAHELQDRARARHVAHAKPALHGEVDRTVDRFGRLDIVVNNAATGLREDLGSFGLDAYTKSMDVNLRGPVFLVEDALPHLKQSPSASIVNVLSAGAFLFTTFTATYAAAKAGLYSFTRSWAAEFAPFGIRVNALAPGTVDTDMVRNTPPESQARMANAAYQRRAAHPDEMVGPALFLASDAGSFVTGQVLIADGGLVPH